MSSNRQRFMALLSKWPIAFPKKEYDYGHRLREILKTKSEIEEIFPGTPSENARKIDALMRLSNNIAKNEFPKNAKVGACGFEPKEMRGLIEQQLKALKKS